MDKKQGLIGFILFLLAPNIYAGVAVTRIQLNNFRVDPPRHIYLRYDDIIIRNTVTRPTEHLASLTNGILQRWTLTAEARDVLRGYLKTPIPNSDTIVLVKGESVDAGLLAPDKILFVCRKYQTIEAMKMVFKLYGLWVRMDQRQRASIKGLLQ